jgi:hypothetical protein
MYDATLDVHRGYGSLNWANVQFLTDRQVTPPTEAGNGIFPAIRGGGADL